MYIYIYIYMYKCEKCERTYNYISLLRKHEKNKRSCVNNEDYTKKISLLDETIKNKINESIKSIDKCIYCNKNFLNKGNLSKHLQNNCKTIKDLYYKKKKLIEKKEKLIENEKFIRQENELKKMRKDIAKLLKNQTKNINITNNITNINSNNKLVININSFGKEDLSHITVEDYKKYLTGFFPGFIKFIEKIHFDENMPSNHNICITNLQSNNLYICDDNEWLVKNKKEELDKFILKKYNILTEKCCELEEKKIISENIVNDFMKFTKNYEDNEAKKITKNDIMLMIYNNRKKIKFEP